MITGTIKKNWKMLITFLAAVIGVLAVHQPENAVCYAADNDTAAIEIRTSKDLLEASKNSDGSYVLMADIDMSVFGADGWKPWNFNGTFDGNGHTLYNMDINTVTDVTEKAYDGNLKEYDTYYAGLFGITKNAVIKDLNIKGAYVNISENEDGNRNKSILAAILAGYMDNTTITGCKVEGYVSLKSTAAMWGTAGIAGFGNGNISGCEADVTLVCTDADKNSADRDEQFMGGIYADGYINVSDCIVNIDGYISEHGYVHSGGITGLYILYPVTGSYVADIAGNTINGKITFFEDNTDRRAYCKAVAGERMNLYSTSFANTDNFVRNEVYDYTVDLKPDNYVRKTYYVDNPYENEQKLVSSEDNSTESSDNGLIKTGSTNNASHSNVLNMSMPVRVIVIVVMIAAAVGIYYYIAGKIRKSRKK